MQQQYILNILSAAAIGTVRGVDVTNPYAVEVLVKRNIYSPSLDQHRTACAIEVLVFIEDALMGGRLETFNLATRTGRTSHIVLG